MPCVEVRIRCSTVQPRSLFVLPVTSCHQSNLSIFHPYLIISCPSHTVLSQPLSPILLPPSFRSTSVHFACSPAPVRPVYFTCPHPPSCGKVSSCAAVSIPQDAQRALHFTPRQTCLIKHLPIWEEFSHS